MAPTTQSHCNNCAGKRHHNVLHCARTTWHDTYDDGAFVAAGSDEYEMLQCCGCDSVTLRHTSEATCNGSGHGPIVVYYPPAISRREPSWLWELMLEEPIHSLLSEVYTAVQNNSRRLAAMGIRATLEAVMLDKVGDQQNFERNLNAFEKAGYLSLIQRDSVAAILEAGHATIHRGWEPTDQDIKTLLDITESVVETV